MKYIKPKKSLGQHFLQDHNIAKKIVNCLTPGKTINILEVGPGKGILTRYLLELKMANIILVELDKDSVNYLSDRFPLHPKLIHDDFLKLDLSSLFNEPFSIIGNFPYNISSQIFFKILENKDRVIETVCMVQKEVAERIVSPANSRKYGILSVLLQAYFDIEYLFTVNPNAFCPPPKVKSALIKLTRNQTKKLNCNEEFFIRIIKTGFNQRRKILKNSLKSIFVSLSLEEALLLKRPEQLSVDQFVQLTNMVENAINNLKQTK